MFDDRIRASNSARMSSWSVPRPSQLDHESWPRSGAGVAFRRHASALGRTWQDLRGEGRVVVGIDPEAVGRDNPTIDEFRLIEDDGRWPLGNGSVIWPSAICSSARH